MKVLKIAGRILLAALLFAVTAAAAVLMFLFFSPAVGRVPDKNERDILSGRSERCSGGEFRNESAVPAMTGEAPYSGERKVPEKTLPAQSPTFSEDMPEDDLSFTWLGHSSFLLQMGKVNVLVDPVLSKRCSPVSFAGPSRFSELPLTAEELPRIDVLFLSHDHYDHLDYRTVRAIGERVGTLVVPLGMDSILTGWGIDKEKIRTLDHWESTEIAGVTFTLTPSQHFSGRNPLRRNRTLWGGVYLDNGSIRVYYTGDGGYSGVFREVRERLGTPRLMISECGQYDPAWAKMHMFPEETVKAGADTGAERLIPVHWGAFCICNHAWDDPIRRVTAAAEAAGLPLSTPRIGQTVTLSELDSCTEHWWEDYN